MTRFIVCVCLVAALLSSLTLVPSASAEPGVAVASASVDSDEAEAVLRVGSWNAQFLIDVPDWFPFADPIVGGIAGHLPYTETRARNLGVQAARQCHDVVLFQEVSNQNLRDVLLKTLNEQASACGWGPSPYRFVMGPPAGAGQYPDSVLGVYERAAEVHNEIVRRLPDVRPCIGIEVPFLGCLGYRIPLPIVPAAPELPQRAHDMMVIASRFPVTNQGHLAFSQCGGGIECFAIKGALWTEIVVDGAPVSIYNTHLDSNEPATRAHQVTELVDFINRTASSSYRIIGGDFNIDGGVGDAAHQSEYTALANTLGSTVGLHDVSVGAEQRQATDGSTKRIDLIFASSGYAARSLVATHHNDLSDHSLLTADLTAALVAEGRWSSEISRPTGPALTLNFELTNRTDRSIVLQDLILAARNSDGLNIDVRCTPGTTDVVVPRLARVVCDASFPMAEAGTYELWPAWRVQGEAWTTTPGQLLKLRVFEPAPPIELVEPVQPVETAFDAGCVHVSDNLHVAGLAVSPGATSPVGFARGSAVGDGIVRVDFSVLHLDTVRAGWQAEYRDPAGVWVATGKAVAGTCRANPNGTAHNFAPAAVGLVGSVDMWVPPSLDPAPEMRIRIIGSNESGAPNTIYDWATVN